MSAYSKVGKSDDPSDETMITEDDVFDALSDILDAAPELMEFVLTCYPPELMVHLSPELRKQTEDAYVQSDKKDSN